MQHFPRKMLHLVFERANREGGRIVIESSAAESDLCILTVRDNGLGMSADQLDKLFEPFTRFGDTEKEEGTGIGLSICKKLIEQMEGNIRAESTHGEGSVFFLELNMGDGGSVYTYNRSAPVSLLYIEDDAAQQSLLGKWAEKMGWNIVFARDAANGIDEAMKNEYDAILLDIELPGGFSGLDVKSVLDEMESLRNTPCIGISIHGSQADFDRAKQAGFAAYLAKPVDLVELERRIYTLHTGANNGPTVGVARRQNPDC